MNDNLTPRLNRTFAELEFDLWEGVMTHEVKIPFEYSFGIHIEPRQDLGHAPIETVDIEVTVTIRRKEK